MNPLYCLFALSVAASLAFSSCSGEGGKEVAPVEVDFLRYEVVFHKMGTELQQGADCVPTYLKHFEREKFGMTLVIFQVDSVAYAETPAADSLAAQNLCADLQDSLGLMLYDSLLARMPAGTDLATQFGKPFARLKAAYPDIRLPRLRSFAQGPEVGTEWQQLYLQNRARWYPEAGFLGFAMDFYTGADATYLNPEMPKYVRALCTPEHLLPNVLHEIALKFHSGIEQRDQPKLLDYMINAGIRCQFIRSLAPTLADSLILNYTADQMAWCYANEREIYNVLLPLLYEQNPMKYERYINMAPFTAAMGPEAPARLAEFIGWRIVSRFVKETAPELPTLMENRDYESIFRKAGYKPGT